MFIDGDTNSISALQRSAMLRRCCVTAAQGFAPLERGKNLFEVLRSINITPLRGRSTTMFYCVRAGTCCLSRSFVMAQHR
jgi:hypothetical protein